jgi:dihydrodiol dehydrogenase / D-xylose 1-dehydrogenase (NADP)
MSGNLLISPIPPPYDDPSAVAGDDLLSTCPPLRWGILGCGRVSHDFCLALRNHVPTATVVACAAANDNDRRAEEFATLHSIPHFYTSYSDLVANPDVEIVYVGNVHCFRKETAELCLRAGKHCLLEKPFACTVPDAEHLIALAREMNLFLQEGMWTRFFPVIEQARRIVEQGIIGNVVNITTDFHFDAADSEHYPSSFVYQRQLGGGASLLVGPYPVALALLFFGGRLPEQVHVVGQVDTDRTGVDLQAAVVLRFDALTANEDTVESRCSTDEDLGDANSPHVRGTGVATISYGMLGESEEITSVVGTKGRFTIHSPCHCPTSLQLKVKGTGRGQAAQTIDYSYPLQVPKRGTEEEGNPQLVYFYPNSEGFCYEAAAIARCIAAGKPCCPQYTLKETLLVQKILQEARVQLHIKSIYDV